MVGMMVCEEDRFHRAKGHPRPHEQVGDAEAEVDDMGLGAANDQRRRHLPGAPGDGTRARSEQDELRADCLFKLAAHQGRSRIALVRSEEHTSELQSLMRISYAVFCLKKKKEKQTSKIIRRVYQ